MKKVEVRSPVIANARRRLLHYLSRGSGATSSCTTTVTDKSTFEETCLERCNAAHRVTLATSDVASNWVLALAYAENQS